MIRALQRGRRSEIPGALQIRRAPGCARHGSCVRRRLSCSYRRSDQEQARRDNAPHRHTLVGSAAVRVRAESHADADPRMAPPGVKSGDGPLIMPLAGPIGGEIGRAACPGPSRWLRPASWECRAVPRARRQGRRPSSRPEVLGPPHEVLGSARQSARAHAQRVRCAGRSQGRLAGREVRSSSARTRTRPGAGAQSTLSQKPFRDTCPVPTAVAFRGERVAP